ncbi:hypothetical protein WUBG_19104, partial [Wuchereria bancrofti]
MVVQARRYAIDGCYFSMLGGLCNSTVRTSKSEQKRPPGFIKVLDYNLSLHTETDE